MHSTWALLFYPNKSRCLPFGMLLVWKACFSCLSLSFLFPLQELPIASVQRSIVAKEVSIGYQHVDVLISNDHVRGCCRWLFRCVVSCVAPFLPLFLLLVDTLPAIFTVALGHWILIFVSSDFAHDSCPRSSTVFVGAIFGGGDPSLFRIVFHYRELGASWPLEYDRLHNPHGHMEGVVHATLALRANCLSCSLHIKSTNEIDRGTRSDRIKCFPAHALES